MKKNKELLNMNEKEKDEYYTNYPKYEMETIEHSKYSHIITINYGSDIIAFKSNTTGKWILTTELLEKDPEGMKHEFPILIESNRRVPLEEMLKYFTKEELFTELL